MAAYPSNMAPIGVKLWQNAFRTICTFSFFDANFLGCKQKIKKIEYLAGRIFSWILRKSKSLAVLLFFLNSSGRCTSTRGSAKSSAAAWSLSEVEISCKINWIINRGNREPGKHFPEMFAKFSQVFRSFRKFFEDFGLALTCPDLFGCVRMRSDASGCVQMHSDTFENFKTLAQILIFFRDFQWLTVHCSAQPVTAMTVATLGQ